MIGRQKEKRTGDRSEREGREGSFQEGRINMTGSIAVIGAALTVIAAGVSIGWLGRAAVGSIARQPEAGGRIQASLLIAAAMIEGVALFALIVCILGK